MAAHAELEGRIESRRSNWRKHEAPAVDAQIRALEETIGLIERETKSVASALAKAEAEERHGGISSVGSPAELEPMLGVLEDKHMNTSRELEEARLLSYLPSVEGYQLRFGYNDNYLGFKELLLEELSGSCTLSVAPGAGDGVRDACLPSVVLRLSRPKIASRAGTAPNSCDGAYLRFLGQGVSLISRREMLGVSLSPNISLQRLDVSVQFTAVIPLVYHPRRRAWRVDAGFKIELLHAKEVSSVAPEHLLRVLVQSLVEGVMKHFVHHQLGPHLGDYLRTAREGAEIEMDLSVRGLPVRTFDANLADWAAGKLSAQDERHAASIAANTLGIDARQAQQMAQVERLVPGMPAGSAFGSLGSMLRYYDRVGLSAPHLRAALSKVWQQAVDELCTTPHNDIYGPHASSTVEPLNMATLFDRLAALKRKPAEVAIRFCRVRLGMTLQRAITSCCDAVASSLARFGAEHSSARMLLDRFRTDASAALTALSRTIERSSAELSAQLHGGAGGWLRCVAQQIDLEGAACLSRLMSPPDAKPYAVLGHMLPDGRLQLLLSLSSHAKNIATTSPTSETTAATTATASSPPTSSIPWALPLPALYADAGREVGDTVASGPGLGRGSSPTLLLANISQMIASVMVGSLEVVRLQLLQLPSQDSNDVASNPPSLPPIPLHQSEIPWGNDLVYSQRMSRDVGVASADNSQSSTASGSSGCNGYAPDGQSSLDGYKQVVVSRKLVDVFENQRRLTIMRPYSRADLFPLDPANWSDEHMRVRYKGINLVPLPSPLEGKEGARRNGGGGGGGGCNGGGSGGSSSSSEAEGVYTWRWAGEWSTDVDGSVKDAAGWMYALNWNTGWLSQSNAITHVRRRRWVRYAELVRAETESSGVVEHASSGSTHASDLLLERAQAIEESIDAARESSVSRPPPTDAALPATEARSKSISNAWIPICSSGAAVLQLSCAKGARVRLSTHDAEFCAQPALLFDHLSEILQEQLARHPWYAEPLRVASERARQHLRSDKLHVHASIKVESIVDGEGFHVTIEGVPVEGAEGGDHVTESSDASKTDTTQVCATLVNEINLLDILEDVYEIYKSFTTNIAMYNVNPATPCSRESAESQGYQ